MFSFRFESFWFLLDGIAGVWRVFGLRLYLLFVLGEGVRVREGVENLDFVLKGGWFR